MLLILAGVSINLVLDQNGIIQKSKDARREYGQAKENEQKDLSNLSDMIDEATGKVAKIDVNTKANKNGTINGEEGNSNNPTIPEGYTPINTDTSNWGDGNSAPTQDSVDHGLVIRDDNNNEWVWVPVDSETLATMYETSSDEKTLCGTEGETAVTTNKYSKTMTIGKDNNTKTISRTTPGPTTTAPYYREPDLVIGWNGEDYDAKEEFYKTILGFASKEEMAKAFVADYNEMIASIEKYGGFYIGRYELSQAGVQKDKVTLVKTNWYNMYIKCKGLNASNKVETRIIWGCQWDVTCNFIANKGDQKNIIDSSSWGNYKGTSVKADDGITEIKASGIKKALNTGKTTFTMANNIYDIAGNCYEWTQEVGLENNRVYRGGCYDFDGSYLPAYSSNGSGYNADCDYTSYVRYSSNFNNKVTLRV